MKRILSFITAIILVATMLCMAGCGTGDDSSGRLRVTVTIFPPYDFVRQIAGDKVELTMLLSPETESHGFEPTLKDLSTIQQSDVFIYIGGESENWVSDSLAAIDTSGLTVVRLMDYVQPLDEQIIEGMEPEDDGEDSEPETDEHIWTSPRNAIKIVTAICDVLCSIDSENAEQYTQSALAYTESLADLDAALSELTANSSYHTLVFADRFPFAYLANDYGLNYYAAFPGCSTETEPSLATINFLVEKINAEHLPAVMYIEFSKQTVADVICEATGARKLLLHSCHNLSQEDFDSGITYLDIMLQNIRTLEDALN